MSIRFPQSGCDNGLARRCIIYFSIIYKKRLTFIVPYAIIFSVDGLNGRRAPVAQSAERRLGKAEVSSSSLPGSFLIWRVSEDEARFVLTRFHCETLSLPGRI